MTARVGVIGVGSIGTTHAASLAREMFAGRMALTAAYPSGRSPRRQHKSSEVSRARAVASSSVLGSFSSRLIPSSHCSGVTDSVVDDSPGRLGSSMFM